jgi:hypothetical protein
LLVWRNSCGRWWLRWFSVRELGVGQGEKLSCERANQTQVANSTDKFKLRKLEFPAATPACGGGMPEPDQERCTAYRRHQCHNDQEHRRPSWRRQLHHNTCSLGTNHNASELDSGAGCGVRGGWAQTYPTLAAGYTREQPRKAKESGRVTSTANVLRARRAPRTTHQAPHTTARQHCIECGRTTHYNTYYARTTYTTRTTHAPLAYHILTTPSDGHTTHHHMGGRAPSPHRTVPHTARQDTTGHGM